jgi:hypothetical protein
MTRQFEGSEAPPPRSANQIDENLKRVYQDMVEPEIPDRFKALLDQLRQQDRQP